VGLQKWKKKLNWLEDAEQEQKGANALRVQKAISHHPIQRSNSSSRFANGV
jgi:hypothetical protein